MGDFAYVSDIRDYSEGVVEALKGVKILVLSALRQTPSLMHFTIEEAIAFARKAGVEQTFLTHLSHEVDHDSVNAILPSDVQLGYDGLELEFTF